MIMCVHRGRRLKTMLDGVKDKVVAGGEAGTCWTYTHMSIVFGLCTYAGFCMHTDFANFRSININLFLKSSNSPPLSLSKMNRICSYPPLS